MIIFLLLSLLLPAQAYENKDILGHWKFSEMIYRGQRVPLPNPDLNLNWTFFKNGTERLYWDRATPDFCERFSYYNFVDSDLMLETFFLNPRNASDCSKDPDMQLGKKTKIKIEVLKEELHFFFQLGEEELIYVLKPIGIQDIEFFSF
jgi:hypothetical protein